MNRPLAGPTGTARTGPTVPAPRHGHHPASGPADGPASDPGRTVPGPRTPPESPAPPAPAPDTVVSRRAPGLLEIAVAAAVYVGLQLGLGALALGAGLAGPWLAAVSAVSAFGAVGAALAVRVRDVTPLALRPARPSQLVAGVGIGLGVWLLASALMALWFALGHTLPPAQQELWQLGGTGELVALGLFAVLVVPLGEELLFRGLLVSALSRYGLVIAATVGSVLFGLAHGLAFVALAGVLLGVANTLTVWRWRTVWPAVAAHATFNAISFGLVA